VEYPETNYGLVVSLLVVNCVGSIPELVFTPAVCAGGLLSFFSCAYSVATLLGKVSFGPWLVGCSVDAAVFVLWL
jgi:hypothetical protein